jgi:hypothetical protein
MASDGRRGRLTGKGKTRQLSQANASADQGTPNNHVQPGNVGYDVSKQSNGQSNSQTTGQAAGSGEVEYKKGVPSDNFTEEEDKILMRMKTEDAQWGDILKLMNGKSKKECSQRFNQIRPDDFFEKKNAAKGDGKGGNKGNQKNQKQNNQAQEKKDEKTEEKTDEPWGVGGWGDMGGLDDMLGGADDKKSEASNDPKANDQGGAGNVEPGGWSSSADWAAPAANDNNEGGKKTDWDNNGGGGGDGSWPVGSNDTNVGGDTNGASWAGVGDAWNTNGDKTGGAEGTKEGDNAKKGEGKKSKKEKKQESKEKGNDKSDTKESGPNVSTNTWDATDGGKDSGSGVTTAGWDHSGWQTGDNEDKKSDNKKSKSSSSSSSKAGTNNTWNMNGDNAGATGGPSGVGTAAGWVDNKADTGGAPDFAGWGGAAPSEKGKSSKDDPKKKDAGPAPEPWNTWAAPTTPQKPTSRASSKDHEKHRSSRRHSESREGKHRSHRHHSSSHPAEYKVAPDGTFSQDELKLIARILQQDCSMVWERVSWRFKDKTGRNLHPDVFEKKITGRLDKDGRH